MIFRRSGAVHRLFNEGGRIFLLVIVRISYDDLALVTRLRRESETEAGGVG